MDQPVYTEPSDMDIAMYERECQGLPPVGPLTRDQQAGVEAYERYCEESEAEHEEEQKAGGRTVCPSCGKRSVVHKDVCTLGYPGHPGAEMSDCATCETPGCGYTDLAG